MRIGDWVSPPFDIVLISSSSFPMVENGFDFVNLFSFNEFRWWFREVLSIDFILLVRLQQCSIEDVMDSPCGG